MNLKVFVVLFLVMVTISCVDEKKEKLLEERISLLEKQLEDCNNGEDRLIGRIKNQVELKDNEQVILAVNELSKKFPGSTFLTEANQLKTQAYQNIENIKLEAEKKAIAEVERKKASLKKIKSKYDDIDGTTWYKQRYFTHYTNTNRTSIEMGHNRGSTPWLILFMSYTGDDWIFFDNAYLSFDGDTKEIYFDRYRNKKSDNGSGEVWEWIKVQINDSEIGWYKRFASSANAKMRLKGKYQKTRNLSSQERQGILDIIEAYEFLKENPNN